MENYERLARDIAAKNIRVTSLPVVLYVESVAGCPYTCIMCPIANTKPKDISTELLERIQPIYKYLDVLSIHGYGEPTLTRHLGHFIDVCREHDCYLHMNTTGFFLNPHLVERLLECKLSIRFSFHAGTPETYRKIMGQHFDKVVKNVGCLVERSARSALGPNHFWLSYLVMKETINEIEQFLRLAKHIGIHNVRFMKLRPNRPIVRGTKRAEEGFTFNFYEQFNRDVQKQFLRDLPHIRALASELGIRIEPGDMEGAAEEPFVAVKDVINGAYGKLRPGKKLLPIVPRQGMCTAPWMGQLTVKQSGEIGLCCHTYYSLGNLFEKGFEEIWNDAPIQHIRQAFHSGKIPRECGYCRGIGIDEYPQSRFTRMVATESIGVGQQA